MCTIANSNMQAMKVTQAGPVLIVTSGDYTTPPVTPASDKHTAYKVKSKRSLMKLFKEL